MTEKYINSILNKAVNLRLILTRLPTLLAQCSQAHWVTFNKLDLLHQLPEQVAQLVKQCTEQADELTLFAEALAEYEAQLETLLTALGITVLLQNRVDSLVVVYNKQRPCPEIIGDTVSWSTTQTETIRHLQQQVQATQALAVTELSLQDGAQMRWYCYAAFPWSVQQPTIDGVLILILDITPKYLTTAFLNSPSFFYLKQFAAHSPAIVSLISYTLDRFLFLNQTFQQLTGYQPEPFYHGDTHYLSCIPATNLANSQQQLRTLLIEHQLTNIESPFLDAHGKIQYYLSNFFPIYNESKQLICFSALSIDITNRKELLFYNNERELILKELAETVQKVFFIYECIPSHKALYINNAYEQIWGYSTESFYESPMSWLDAVHPEDKEFIKQAYLKIKEKPFDHCYRIINRRGELLWIRARSYSITDQSGQVVRVVGVAEDITEQWQQQQAIKASAHKFHSLVESINEICFIYALKPQKFLYISPASENILGYSPSQFYQNAQLWSHCIHPADRTPTLQNSLFAPESSVQKYRMLHATGKIVWLSVHKSLVQNALPQEDWLIGLAEDISHYQSIIEELKFTCQRAQQTSLMLQEDKKNLLYLSQVKDDFMANMSHELRTPLGIILNIADLLNQGIYGELNEKQIQVLSTIEESGEHLLNLINDILMLSKIEAGKLKLDLSVIKIEEICESCLRLVRETGYKKSLSIQWENQAFDAVAPLVVQGEMRRLKQILVNLLSNAIKFTPMGGSIILRLSACLEQKMIFLSVIDTGNGISKTEQNLLFKPFSQLDHTKANHEGTGLGLYLVMCLTELHGGQVSLNSELGQGCEFTVALPWYLPAVELELLEGNSAVETIKPEAEDALKIVLVDDQLENLNAFKDYLCFKGYQVQTANNAKAGLALIEEWQAQMVLMDIQMPEMDGLEAIRCLRQNYATQHIFIIALTALATSADQERCLTAGADQYLSKPVSLKHLLQIIEQYLAQKT